MTGQLKILLLITGLTFISGVSDSFGFIHGTNVWQGGKLIWQELVKSAGGFVVGTTSYWIAVRYLNLAGIVTTEMQTLLWFGSTLIGVALLSGRFLHWRHVDQIVAVFVLIGIGWLLSRTSS